MTKSDDIPVGRILSRREIMQIFGTTFLVGSSGFVFGKPAPSIERSVPPCIVRPEQTEGPFFKDIELERSDLRVDPSTGIVFPGLPLHLTFQILRVGSEECVPLPGARVDLWQCDIAGRYSAFRDRGSDLREEKFLRGYQLADEGGMVQFMTIYPGWYRGRTVHIHIKIRTKTEQGKQFEFSSQLYFDDDLTDQVHSNPPYNVRGMRTTRNSNDGIFRRTGKRLVLDLSPGDKGYQATFPVGLDLSSSD
ncbi:MAG: intradiol ring-cleavage dioxygenase [Bacteroidetes bacterium]|nr:intradiol ring-cleavage dioxygenase [Bacteroidota bacterium]